MSIRALLRSQRLLIKSGRKLAATDPALARALKQLEASIEALTGGEKT